MEGGRRVFRCVIPAVEHVTALCFSVVVVDGTGALEAVCSMKYPSPNATRVEELLEAGKS